MYELEALSCGVVSAQTEGHNCQLATPTRASDHLPASCQLATTALSALVLASSYGHVLPAITSAFRYTNILGMSFGTRATCSSLSPSRSSLPIPQIQAPSSSPEAPGSTGRCPVAPGATGEEAAWIWELESDE